MKDRKCILIIGLILSLSTIFIGCKEKIGYTTVYVPDSIRHYYPILAGQNLNLSCEIENTGDNPLVIREIQPDCGCIAPTLKSRLVLPGKTVVLKFTYESAKNIGYVQHIIRIHCNAGENGIVKLIFDTNVVPHADYTRDYEELYQETVEKNQMIRGLVDGTENEKGYYVDENDETDSRTQPKYFWREEEEEEE